MVSKYFLENWALILILLAFSISLKITVFLDSKIIKRLYVLIVYVFLLSIMVHIEFFFAKQGSNNDLRIVLMAFRYSATPFIVAQVIYTLAKKFRAFVFVPAIIHAIINFASIKNGVVFSIDSDGTFHRGSLGLLPFIVAGIYCAFLVYILFKRSNKKAIEIIPIAFLCFSFISGLIKTFAGIYPSDFAALNQLPCKGSLWLVGYPGRRIYFPPLPQLSILKFSVLSIN